MQLILLHGCRHVHRPNSEPHIGTQTHFGLPDVTPHMCGAYNLDKMAAYLTTPALLIKAFLDLGVPDSIQGVHQGIRALFAGLPHFDSTLLLQGLLLAPGEVDHLALEGQLGLQTHKYSCLNIILSQYDVMHQTLLHTMRKASMEKWRLHVQPQPS